MSLYICQSCGCVENTALCAPYHQKDLVRNLDYPNMALMEMQGFGEDETFVGKVMHYQWKRPNQILMLCSECNTGKWHGEFKKEKATDIDKVNALYSKYNSITPYDHEHGVLEGWDTDRAGRPTTCISGYKVTDVISWMTSQIAEQESISFEQAAKLVTKHPLYKIYSEDIQNFNIDCLYHLDNSYTEKDLLLALKESQKDINKSKSQTFYKIARSRGWLKNNTLKKFAMFAGMAGIDVSEVIESGVRKSFTKPHWKETQSNRERELKLEKASIRRQIKALKKELHKAVDKESIQNKLNLLQQEYNSLKGV